MTSLLEVVREKMFKLIWHPPDVSNGHHRPDIAPPAKHWQPDEQELCWLQRRTVEERAEIERLEELERIRTRRER